MLGFSPAFTRSGICPKHCVASMYQRTGCEDRGGGSQGVGGNEWAAGWKGRMRWRGRACRSRGGGRGKLGMLGAGAEVWDHEDMLSLGLEAEPGLLTSLLSVNICEQLLDVCVYCLLLPSVSFCRKWPSSAVNFSGGEVCCGCRKVMLFQPAWSHLDSPSISAEKGRWSFSRIASQKKQLSIYWFGNKGKDGICILPLNYSFIAQEGDNHQNYFVRCSGRR